MTAPPNLPTTHDGHPITWGQWDTPGIASCGRPVTPKTCTACGHVGLRHRAGTVTGEQRVHAWRCPGCGETSVHWRTDPEPRTYRCRFVRIACWPPATT